MTRDREAGVALLSAILVLMLMSAILVGFITMVNTDQAASGINRDQTQAYAAAHAGVEKLTSDLGNYFQTNFAPTGAQIATLYTAGQQPVLPGIQYLAPNGSTGYRISFTDGPIPPADGNPDLENPNGSTITAGPYEGLVGLITPYNIEVSARTTGGAEVRMRRVLQTVAIPVFQFGIFSENDLSFFAGPNFAFGGRIHTNQHLFLKQDAGATLTLQDRVTAVGEIIRSHLANGVTGTHPGEVRVALATGCPAAPAAINASCRALADTEGSLINNLGSAPNEPTWTNLSAGTYNGWIRSGRTGARTLSLPVVSNGARPVDLIRRPPVGEVVTSDVGQQRFFNMATLRIVISDSPGDFAALPNAPTTANVSPMPLDGQVALSAAEAATAGAFSNVAATNNKIAGSVVGTAYDPLKQAGYRTTAGTSSIGGYILISRQDRSGAWTDVTKEIMNLGFIGRRLSNGNAWQIDPRAAAASTCVDPHPNAIIRIQRYKDTATAAQCNNGAGVAPTFATNAAAVASDFIPNVLYDPREGMLRDNEAGRPVAPAFANPQPVGHATNDPRLYWGGVMHYVEFDVANFRRWLQGTTGTSNAPACYNGGSIGTGTCAMDLTGYVVYFSDRRGNRDFGADNVADAPTVTAVVPAPGGISITYPNDLETGELGFEDIINTTATSAANGALDHFFTDASGNNHSAEDLNWELPSVPAGNAPGRGTLQTYGGRPRLLPRVAAAHSAGTGPNQMLWLDNVLANDLNYSPQGDPSNVNTYTLYTSPVDRDVARVNRAFFFRRALKLVNGGLMMLPRNGSQGLTVAAENPVYIQGDYNACGTTQPTTANNFTPPCVGGVGFGANPGVDHVSAAVIGDAVTLLSNAWNDIRSFNDPHDASLADAAPYTNNGIRQSTTTWYRTAIISGKGYNFPRANVAPVATDNADFGTDGGAHNFLRYIEHWGGMTLNYRGSIVSFFINRQAVGTYKCCDIVYGPPARGYNFDTEFLTPTLLPPRTPMFRDINTLTFRQVLRPTQ